MSQTILTLRESVLTRLGDPAGAIWSQDEVDLWLNEGSEVIGQRCEIFYEWTYLENLPPSASCTHRFELAYIEGLPEGFFCGIGTFTCEDERRTLGDERLMIGPFVCSSPCEATDGFVSVVGASTAIPATADLPEDVTQLSRVTWDGRVTDALTARQTQARDARYELTTGEVYGYIWQKDGVRTLRKVRVPSAQASTVTAVGSWGVCRDVSDLMTFTPDGEPNIPRIFSHTSACEDPYLGGIANLGLANYTTDDELDVFASGFETNGPAWYTAPFEYADGFLTTLGIDTPEPATVAWGFPRRIPGFHPIGPTHFGIARRFFLDSANVRAEYFRQGQPMEESSDACELPDRYALYLQDFAQWKLLERKGPGQDLKLSGYFKRRWERNLLRVDRRMTLVDREQSYVIGGGRASTTTAPPLAQLPWQYAPVVR